MRSRGARGGAVLYRSLSLEGGGGEGEAAMSVWRESAAEARWPPFALRRDRGIYRVAPCPDGSM